MSLRLYDWGPSPFCLKIRALLDYKRLEYERINILGGALVTVRRRGRIGKVPALEADGELICDSTDIAYAVEERAPEPPVIPRDGRDRALCHALEEWADESLYFLGLYFQWVDPAGKEMVPRAFGRSPLGRLTYQFFQRRIHAQLRGQGTGRKPREHIERDLARNLDAAEALTAGGAFLLGDRPHLCDFALMGQLVYLQRTPVGGAALAGRPAITAYLERMKGLRRPG